MVSKPVSLISWNVNGIRAVHGKGFLHWLQEESPDILCIQESKAQEGQLVDELRAPEGYHTFWTSAEKKGYSGTATFTRTLPEKVETFGIEEFDREGRVQVVYFQDFVLLNAYFPNSQEKGKRLDYKLAFCQSMLELCNHLSRDGLKLILCGDYNIAHKAIDLANPEANVQNPGYLPEERAWMDEFVQNGYIDAFREFCQDPDQYTWWSYRTRARERNAGWRIDYHCYNPALREAVKNCSIMDHVMGSDHCPVKLELEL